MSELQNNITLAGSIGIGYGPSGIGGARVFAGTGDPSGGAGLQAPLGSLFLQTDTAATFQKTGPLATDWTAVGAGGGLSGSGWSWRFNSGNQNVPQGATRWFRVDTIDSVESDCQQPIGFAMTATRLDVQLEGALPVAETYTFDLRVNGASPGGIPTLVITGPAGAGTATGSQLLAVSDLVTIQVVTSALAGASETRCTLSGTFN